MSYTLEIGKFVTVPLKKSSDIDLVKPIETFARNTFDKVSQNKDNVQGTSVPSNGSCLCMVNHTLQSNIVCVYFIYFGLFFCLCYRA